MDNLSNIHFACLVTLSLLAASCGDINKHQFDLKYDETAELTVVCGNCSYYTGTADSPQKIIIKRTIDREAIALFSSIKFCGLGDTTPDASVRIETDKGLVAGFGILYPDQKFNSSLRIQSSQTGLGQGCSAKDQERFENFFEAFLSRSNL